MISGNVLVHKIALTSVSLEFKFFCGLGWCTGTQKQGSSTGLGDIQVLRNRGFAAQPRLTFNLRSSFLSFQMLELQLYITPTCLTKIISNLFHSTRAIKWVVNAHWTGSLCQILALRLNVNCHLVCDTGSGRINLLPWRGGQYYMVYAWGAWSWSKQMMPCCVPSVVFPASLWGPRE